MGGMIRSKREVGIKSESKNSIARKNEKIAQGYYSSIIKYCEYGKEQMKHKPYQRDVKLK